jgi:hypothetical protein
MKYNNIPENYIMQNHPNAHWSLHIIGHYVDAILEEKVTMKVLRHSVIKQLLYEKYVTLCIRKEIVPIEQLSQDQKMELWEEAKTISTDKDDCIKIAKCIYTIHDIAETLYRRGDN